jgi:fatty-acyl-CoA synthase
MRGLIDEMGVHEITIGYGMTETSPVSFQSRPEDTFERRVSTVGRTHPHVEAKIVGDLGRIVHVTSRGSYVRVATL